MEGRTKEGEKHTAIEDSMKGIDETEMITNEKNMKEEPSEKQNHLERLLVTAKEAPAYNLEVLFSASMIKYSSKLSTKMLHLST